MRAREFIVENTKSLAVTNLLDALDSIRNRFRETGQEPKIRVDSLISMVRGIPGSEMFNVDTLKDLYDRNTTLKNLISSIKKDDKGNNYIYIKPAIADPDSISSEIDIDTDSEVSPDQSVSTVDKMAKRAAARRL